MYPTFKSTNRQIFGVNNIFHLVIIIFNNFSGNIAAKVVNKRQWQSHNGKCFIYQILSMLIIMLLLYDNFSGGRHFYDILNTHKYLFKTSRK